MLLSLKKLISYIFYTIKKYVLENMHHVVNTDWVWFKKNFCTLIFNNFSNKERITAFILPWSLKNDIIALTKKSIYKLFLWLFLSLFFVGSLIFI